MSNSLYHFCRSAMLKGQGLNTYHTHIVSHYFSWFSKSMFGGDCNLSKFMLSKGDPHLSPDNEAGPHPIKWKQASSNQVKAGLIQSGEGFIIKRMMGFSSRQNSDLSFSLSSSFHFYPAGLQCRIWPCQTLQSHELLPGTKSLSMCAYHIDSISLENPDKYRIPRHLLFSLGWAEWQVSQRACLLWICR